MKIASIGAGKMAGALVRGLVAARVCKPEEISVSDASAAARDCLATELGLRAATSNRDAIEGAEVVLLCVKPADAPAAIESCRDGLAGKLLVSIVAGFALDRLAALAGDDVRVVRAMPNTPAQFGCGAAAYAAGRGATETDLDVAGQIFRAVGVAFPVAENLLDAVTGLSGSGPAYVCLVIEALSDGGVAAGLPRGVAAQLAVQTVLGTARMIAESGQHPAILREAVTSPGGTTAAALAVLESAAVRSAFVEAIAAATDRSAELGQ